MTILTMECDEMLQSWEESAVSNGYKFVIAIGTDMAGEFEIIAVSKTIATSEKIVDDYAVNTGCVIVICNIETQRMVSVMNC